MNSVDLTIDKQFCGYQWFKKKLILILNVVGLIFNNVSDGIPQQTGYL